MLLVLLFSAHHGALSRVQVKYMEMPGWSEDTSKVRKFTELPVNAQRYVEKIEEMLGVPSNNLTNI